MLGTVLGAGDSMVNQTDVAPALIVGNGHMKQIITLIIKHLKVITTVISSSEKNTRFYENNGLHK